MLPDIPTDNLYKFKTVLGMILFVFSAWLANDTYTSATDTLDKQSITTAIAQGAMADVHQAQTRLEQLSAKAATPEEKATRDQEVKDLQTKLEASLDAMNKATKEIALQEQRVNYTYWRVVIMVIVFLIGSITGILMINNGFNAWSKHQTLQDDLLKEQVLAARNANMSPPTPTSGSAAGGP